MHHVEKNPWSEVCWYFTESREQYRLGGKLTVVTQDEKDADLKQVQACSCPDLLPGSSEKHSASRSGCCCPEEGTGPSA